MWKWDILNLQVGDWECFEMGPELPRGVINSVTTALSCPLETSLPWY